MDKLQNEKEVPEKEESEFSTKRSNFEHSKDMQQKKVRKEKDTDIALKDPTVKSFLNTFKAHIISVEPIKRSKN